MGSLFGNAKSAINFEVGTYAEVEFFMDDTIQSHFVPVHEVQKQTITLGMPGTEMRPINLFPGLEVKVSYSDVKKNEYYSFEVTIEDAMGREFSFTCPENPDTTEIGTGEGENFVAPCPVPLDFQALGMGDYLQRAVGIEMGYHSMIIQTNLPVPDGTELKVSFDLPGLSDFELRGVVQSSLPIPEEKKKFRTVLDLKDVFPEQVDSIIAFGTYIKHRNAREARQGKA